MPQERRDDRLQVGASGARIEFTSEDTVVKSAANGVDRLIAQAMMMKAVGKVVFPEIIFIGPHYYEMERLIPLKWTRARVAGDIIYEMCAMLPLIWGPYQRVRFGDMITDAHREYMRPRWGPHYRRMENWLDGLLDEEVTKATRIHGDPTVENVMQRRIDQRIVFIDPIPANDYIPSLIAIDMGKMLQSIFGYERILRPDTPVLNPTDTMELAGNMTSIFMHGDKLVSWYFLCVHIARLIPYQPAERQHIFWDMLTHAIEVFKP